MTSPDPSSETRAPASSSAPGGTGSKLASWLGVVVGILYLTFPTLGVIELIPDAIPFIGNLDEAAFTALLLWGLRRLGVDPLKLGGPGPGR